MLQKIKCFFNIHPWETVVCNVRNDNDEILTISAKQCKCCGKSKLIFIYF